MKVLLLNGSPRSNGNTYIALEEISKTLALEGIDSEIFQIGTEPISGCIACGGCNTEDKCIIEDRVADFIEAMNKCDGLIVGTPVYYASPAGSLISLLDRAFYSSDFSHKPAAAVACARRAGTTAALDVINKYFSISQMPIVSSTYWNMVHGRRAGEAAMDTEGLQTMRNLAKNMAWMLKCIEAGKNAGIQLPEAERSSITNFIR